MADGKVENDTLVLLVIYRNGDVHAGVSCNRHTVRLLVLDHLYRHSRRNHCLAGFEAVRGVRKEDTVPPVSWPGLVLFC